MDRLQQVIMVRHLLHKVPKSLHHTGLHHQRTQLTWQRERVGRGGRKGEGGEVRGVEGMGRRGREEEGGGERKREGEGGRGREIEGCDGNWWGGGGVKGDRWVIYTQWQWC